MRKLLYLFTATVLAGSLMTGCDEGENEQPGIDNLAVNGTLGVSSGTHEPGSTINFTFKLTDDDELKSYSITKSVDGNVSTLESEELSGTTKSVDFSYTFSEAAGKQVIFTITVTDSDDEAVARAYTATLASGLDSYSAKLLGAQSSSTGSFLATTTGTVYTIADAKTNSDKVDLVYFYGASNFATLAAPNDTDAATVYDGTNGLATWTVKNATKFKTTSMSVQNFNDVDVASKIKASWDNGTGSEVTKVNSLLKDTVVAFKTASGKYGVALVTNLTTGSTGDITISVKVQK